MNIKAKRLLSLLLTVAMLVSLLPSSAFATDESDGAAPGTSTSTGTGTPTEGANRMYVATGADTWFKIDDTGTASFSIEAASMDSGGTPYLIIFYSDYLDGTWSDASVWASINHPSYGDDALAGKFNSFPVWVFRGSTTGANEVVKKSVGTTVVSGSEYFIPGQDYETWADTLAKFPDITYKAIVGFATSDSDYPERATFYRTYDVDIISSGEPKLIGTAGVQDSETQYFNSATNEYIARTGASNLRYNIADVFVTNIGNAAAYINSIKLYEMGESDKTDITDSFTHSSVTGGSLAGVTATWNTIATTDESKVIRIPYLVSHAGRNIQLEVEYAASENGDTIDTLIVPISIVSKDYFVLPDSITIEVPYGRTMDKTVDFTDVTGEFNEYTLTAEEDTIFNGDLNGDLTAPELTWETVEDEEENESVVSSGTFSFNAADTEKYHIGDEITGTCTYSDGEDIEWPLNVIVKIVPAPATLVATPDDILITGTALGSSAVTTSIDLKAIGSGDVEILAISSTHDSGAFATLDSTVVTASADGRGGTTATFDYTYPQSAGDAGDTITVTYQDETDSVKFADITVRYTSEGAALSAQDLYLYPVIPASGTGTAATGKLVVTNEGTAEFVMSDRSLAYDATGTNVVVATPNANYTPTSSNITFTGTFPVTNIDVGGGNAAEYTITATASSTTPVGTEDIYTLTLEGTGGLSVDIHVIAIAAVSQTTTGTVTVTRGGSDPWTSTSDDFNHPIGVALATTNQPSGLPSGAINSATWNNAKATFAEGSLTVGTTYYIYVNRGTEGTAAWENAGSFTASATPADNNITVNYYAVKAGTVDGGSVTLSAPVGSIASATDAYLFVTGGSDSIDVTPTPDGGYSLVTGGEYSVNGSPATTSGSSTTFTHSIDADNKSDITVTANVTKDEVLYTATLEIYHDGVAVDPDNIDSVTVGGGAATDADPTDNIWTYTTTDQTPVDFAVTTKSPANSFTVANVTPGGDTAKLYLYTLVMGTGTNGSGYFGAEASTDTDNKIVAAGGAAQMIDDDPNTGYEYSGWEAKDNDGTDVTSGLTISQTSVAVKDTYPTTENFGGPITLTPSFTPVTGTITLTITVNGAAPDSVNGFTVKRDGVEDAIPEYSNTSTVGDYQSAGDKVTSYTFTVTTPDGNEHTLKTTAGDMTPELNLYTVEVPDTTAGEKADEESKISGGTLVEDPVANSTWVKKLYLDKSVEQIVQLAPAPAAENYEFKGWTIGGTVSGTIDASDTTHTFSTDNADMCVGGNGITLTPKYTSTVYTATITVKHTTSTGTSNVTEDDIANYTIQLIPSKAPTSPITLTKDDHFNETSDVYEIKTLKVGETYTLKVSPYENDGTNLVEIEDVTIGQGEGEVVSHEVVYVDVTPGAATVNHATKNGGQHETDNLIHAALTTPPAITLTTIGGVPLGTPVASGTATPVLSGQGVTFALEDYTKTYDYSHTWSDGLTKSGDKDLNATATVGTSTITATATLTQDTYTVTGKIIGTGSATTTGAKLTYNSSIDIPGTMTEGDTTTVVGTGDNGDTVTFKVPAGSYTLSAAPGNLTVVSTKTKQTSSGDTMQDNNGAITIAAGSADATDNAGRFEIHLAETTVGLSVIEKIGDGEAAVDTDGYTFTKTYANYTGTTTVVVSLKNVGNVDVTDGTLVITKDGEPIFSNVEASAKNLETDDIFDNASDVTAFTTITAGNSATVATVDIPDTLEVDDSATYVFTFSGKSNGEDVSTSYTLTVTINEVTLESIALSGTTTLSAGAVTVKEQYPATLGINEGYDYDWVVSDEELTSFDAVDASSSTANEDYVVQAADAGKYIYLVAIGKDNAEGTVASEVYKVPYTAYLKVQKTDVPTTGVPSPEPTAVPSAAIKLDPNTTEGHEDGEKTGATDENGVYAVSGLIPGETYTILAPATTETTDLSVANTDTGKVIGSVSDAGDSDNPIEIDYYQVVIEQPEATHVMNGATPINPQSLASAKIKDSADGETGGTYYLDGTEDLLFKVEHNGDNNTYDYTFKWDDGSGDAVATNGTNTYDVDGAPIKVTGTFAQNSYPVKVQLILDPTGDATMGGVTSLTLETDETTPVEVDTKTGLTAYTTAADVADIIKVPLGTYRVVDITTADGIIVSGYKNINDGTVAGGDKTTTNTFTVDADNDGIQIILTDQEYTLKPTVPEETPEQVEPTIPETNPPIDGTITAETDTVGITTEIIYGYNQELVYVSGFTNPNSITLYKVGMAERTDPANDKNIILAKSDAEDTDTITSAIPDGTAALEPTHGFAYKFTFDPTDDDNDGELYDAGEYKAVWNVSAATSSTADAQLTMQYDVKFEIKPAPLESVTTDVTTAKIGNTINVKEVFALYGGTVSTDIKGIEDNGVTYQWYTSVDNVADYGKDNSDDTLLTDFDDLDYTTTAADGGKYVYVVATAGDGTNYSGSKTSALIPVDYAVAITVTVDGDAITNNTGEDGDLYHVSLVPKAPTEGDPIPLEFKQIKADPETWAFVTTTDLAFDATYTVVVSQYSGADSASVTLQKDSTDVVISRTNYTATAPYFTVATADATVSGWSGTYATTVVAKVDNEDDKTINSGTPVLSGESVTFSFGTTPQSDALIQWKQMLDKETSYKEVTDETDDTYTKESIDEKTTVSANITQRQNAVKFILVSDGTKTDTMTFSIAGIYKAGSSSDLEVYTVTEGEALELQLPNGEYDILTPKFNDGALKSIETDGSVSLSPTTLVLDPAGRDIVVEGSGSVTYTLIEAAQPPKSTDGATPSPNPDIPEEHEEGDDPTNSVINRTIEIVYGDTNAAFTVELSQHDNSNIIYYLNNPVEKEDTNNYFDFAATPALPADPPTTIDSADDKLTFKVNFDSSATGILPVGTAGTAQYTIKYASGVKGAESVTPNYDYNTLTYNLTVTVVAAPLTRVSTTMDDAGEDSVVNPTADTAKVGDDVTVDLLTAERGDNSAYEIVTDKDDTGKVENLVTYKWYRSDNATTTEDDEKGTDTVDSEIPDATNPTYTVTTDDVGYYLYVVATGSNNYDKSVYSLPFPVAGDAVVNVNIYDANDDPTKATTEPSQKIYLWNETDAKGADFATDADHATELDSSADDIAWSSADRQFTVTGALLPEKTYAVYAETYAGSNKYKLVEKLDCIPTTEGQDTVDNKATVNYYTVTGGVVNVENTVIGTGYSIDADITGAIDVYFGAYTGVTETDKKLNSGTAVLSGETVTFVYVTTRQVDVDEDEGEDFQGWGDTNRKAQYTFKWDTDEEGTKTPYPETDNYISTDPITLNDTDKSITKTGLLTQKTYTLTFNVDKTITDYGKIDAGSVTLKSPATDKDGAAYTVPATITGEGTIATVTGIPAGVYTFSATPAAKNVIRGYKLESGDDYTVAASIDVTFTTDDTADNFIWVEGIIENLAADMYVGSATSASASVSNIEKVTSSDNAVSRSVSATGLKYSNYTAETVSIVIKNNGNVTYTDYVIDVSGVSTDDFAAITKIVHTAADGTTTKDVPVASNKATFTLKPGESVTVAVTRVTTKDASTTPYEGVVKLYDKDEAVNKANFTVSYTVNQIPVSDLYVSIVKPGAGEVKHETASLSSTSSVGTPDNNVTVYNGKDSATVDASITLTWVKSNGTDPAEFGTKDGNDVFLPGTTYYGKVTIDLDNAGDDPDDDINHKFDLSNYQSAYTDLTGGKTGFEATVEDIKVVGDDLVILYKFPITAPSAPEVIASATGEKGQEGQITQIKSKSEVDVTFYYVVTGSSDAPDAETIFGADGDEGYIAYGQVDGEVKESTGGYAVWNGNVPVTGLNPGTPYYVHAIAVPVDTEIKSDPGTGSFHTWFRVVVQTNPTDGGVINAPSTTEGEDPNKVNVVYVEPETSTGLQVTANDNYVFYEWTVSKTETDPDGEFSGGGTDKGVTTVTFTPERNATVTANFNGQSNIVWETPSDALNTLSKSYDAGVELHTNTLKNVGVTTSGDIYFTIDIEDPNGVYNITGDTNYFAIDPDWTVSDEDNNTINASDGKGIKLTTKHHTDPTKARLAPGSYTITITAHDASTGEAEELVLTLTVATGNIALLPELSTWDLHDNSFSASGNVIPDLGSWEIKVQHDGTIKSVSSIEFIGVNPSNTTTGATSTPLDDWTAGTEYTYTDVAESNNDKLTITKEAIGALVTDMSAKAGDVIWLKVVFDQTSGDNTVEYPVNIRVNVIDTTPIIYEVSLSTTANIQSGTELVATAKAVIDRDWDISREAPNTIYPEGDTRYGITVDDVEDGKVIVEWYVSEDGNKWDENTANVDPNNPFKFNVVDAHMGKTIRVVVYDADTNENSYRDSDTFSYDDTTKVMTGAGGANQYKVQKDATTALKLTFTAVPTGGGTVPNSPQYVQQGGSVQLTATPANNRTFLGWKIKGEVVGAYHKENSTSSDAYTLGNPEHVGGYFFPTVSTDLEAYFGTNPSANTDTYIIGSAAPTDQTVELTYTNGYYTAWSDGTTTYLNAPSRITLTAPDKSSITFTKDTHYELTPDGNNYKLTFKDDGLALLTAIGTYTVTFTNSFPTLAGGTVDATTTGTVTVSDAKLTLSAIHITDDKGNILADGAASLGDTIYATLHYEDAEGNEYQITVGESEALYTDYGITVEWTPTNAGIEVNTDDSDGKNMPSFKTNAGNSEVTFTVTAKSDGSYFAGGPVEDTVKLGQTKHTITVKTDTQTFDGGNVATDPNEISAATENSDTSTATHGGSVWILAVPASGYRFVEWETLSAGVNTLTDATKAKTTVTGITGDNTYTAVFEAVTLTDPKGGSASIVYGTNTFVGDDATVTAASATSSAPAEDEDLTFKITGVTDSTNTPITGLTGYLPEWLEFNEDTGEFTVTGDVDRNVEADNEGKTDGVTELKYSIAITSKHGTTTTEDVVFTIDITPNTLKIKEFNYSTTPIVGTGINSGSIDAEVGEKDTGANDVNLTDEVTWSMDPGTFDDAPTIYTFTATYTPTGSDAEAKKWNYLPAKIEEEIDANPKDYYGISITDSYPAGANVSGTNEDRIITITYGDPLPTIPLVIKNESSVNFTGVHLTLYDKDGAAFTQTDRFALSSNSIGALTAGDTNTDVTLNLKSSTTVTWLAGNSYTVKVEAVPTEQPTEVKDTYTLTIVVEKAVIEEVKLKVDVPVAGYTPDDAAEKVVAADPYTPTPGKTEWSVWDPDTNSWIPMQPGDTFENGNKYKVDVEVTPNDNYEFKVLPSGTINGETATVTGGASKVIVSKEFTIDAKFDIKVSATAPVKGAAPAAPSENDSRYDIISHKWYDSTGKEVTGNFAPNTQYTLWVEVDVIGSYDNTYVDGRYLYDLNDALGSGTFNAATPSGAAYTESGMVDNFLWYTFPATDPEDVNPTPPQITPSQKFEVTYVPGPNGTTNDPLTEEVREGGKPQNVPTITPVDDEHVFIGWITTDPDTLGEDETITTVNPEEVTINGPTTFYAVVTKKEIKVNYDLGSFGSTTDPTEEIVAKYQYPSFTPNVTIIESQKDLAKFVGWSLEKPDHVLEVNLVDPLTVQILKDTTFYAVYEITEYEYHEHYMIGYPDGNFEPDQDITRAEVATIIARAVLPDFIEGSWYGDGGYTDVSGHWAQSAIAFVTAAGIFEGYEDSTFRPNRPITREEYATVIARLKGLLDGTREELSRFADYMNVSEWAIDGVYTCVEEGWIIGYEDETFRAKNDVTRAEAAKMMNGYLNRGVDAPGVSTVPTYIQFPDLYWGHWAYWEVAEAVNDHYYYYYYVDVDGNDTPPEQWVIEAGYLNVALDPNDPDNTKNVRRTDPIYVNSISAGTGSSSN